MSKSITSAITVEFPKNFVEIEQEDFSDSGSGIYDDFDNITEINNHPAKDVPLDYEFVSLFNFAESFENTKKRKFLLERALKNLNFISTKTINSFNSNITTRIATFINNCVQVDSPYSELPTALIFAGTNLPDHENLCIQLKYSIIKEYKFKTATLLNQNCQTIQHAMTSIIDQFMYINDEDAEYDNSLVIEGEPQDGSDKECEESTFDWRSERVISMLLIKHLPIFKGRSKPLSYDINLLRTWYKQKKTNQIKKLVIFVRDFESIEHKILCHVIQICSLNRSELPFVFVLFLATSMETINQNIPKNVLNLMSFEKFFTKQSSNFFDLITKNLFISSQTSSDCSDNEFNLKLSYNVFDLCWTKFNSHTLCVESYLKDIKFAVLDHYYGNPLSVLTDYDSKKGDDDVIEALQSYHFTEIRNLPSFKSYVNARKEKEAKKMRNLITDDVELKKFIKISLQDLDKYHQNFDTAFNIILSLRNNCHLASGKISLKVLYNFALKQNLLESPQIKFALKSMRKTISILEENSNQNLLEETVIFKKLLADFKSYEDEDYVSSSEASSSEDEISGKKLKRSLEFVETEKIYKRLKLETARNTKKKEKENLHVDKLSENYFFEKDLKENQNFIEKINGRTNKNSLCNFTDKIVDFYENFFRTNLKWHKFFPLNEIKYYSKESRLKKAFSSQPREALRNAFLNPTFYLQCECCSDIENFETELNKNQNDMVIVYKLFKESGKMINLYDWYISFGTVLDDGKIGLDPNLVLARFARCITQLQFLGFIKVTNKKVDHVLKLTFW
ncbi:Origin recognition complex subunit 3 [Clydaea vesicula]|uniref:Origin recognition complex subunit 3 n=1 Tax=Clydaea vesicula TaxID=447962 RepID=A0AAD5U0F3_9FUNG|nr:Origin recognition complex subunit 3 [Clydaea vesicula]